MTKRGKARRCDRNVARPPRPSNEVSVGQRRYFLGSVGLKDWLVYEGEQFLLKHYRNVPDEIYAALTALASFSSTPGIFLSSRSLRDAFSWDRDRCFEWLILSLELGTLKMSDAAISDTQSCIPSGEMSGTVTGKGRSPSSPRTIPARILTLPDPRGDRFGRLRALKSFSQAPERYLRSEILKRAFKAGSLCCLYVVRHLLHFPSTLPEAQVIMLQDKQIALDNMGRVASAGEISSKLKQRYGVEASKSLVGKYIRRINLAESDIFDAYYRVQLKASSCSEKGARTLYLFGPHQLEQTLESVAEFASEIKIVVPMKGEARFRHSADLRGDDASPVVTKVSVSP